MPYYRNVTTYRNHRSSSKRIIWIETWQNRAHNWHNQLHPHEMINNVCIISSQKSLLVCWKYWDHSLRITMDKVLCKPSWGEHAHSWNQHVHNGDQFANKQQVQVKNMLLSCILGYQDHLLFIRGWNFVQYI